MSAIVICVAGILFGISVGIGISLGFEIVMRLTGDGRTVLLTWARTKADNNSGENS